MADDGNGNDLSLLGGDAKIIQEAKNRFERCRQWESVAQTRFVDDLKFAHADPDNGWQWPNYLWSQRQDDPTGYKPRLTVNKVRQHNLQIKNDSRKNKPGIKVSPVGNEATFKAAQAWSGLIRFVEKVSRAQNAYDQANSFQVDGGIGYLRVVTDYADDDSFDQEIYIRGVANPLNVYLDPDHKEIDGSDARFGFVFDDMAKDEFLREYPDMKDKISTAVLGNERQWVDADHVRVVEYFARTMTRDKLVLMLDPETKKEIIARWSRIPRPIRDAIDPDTIIREREILEHTIKWYKIAADEIVERGTWPGRYIPIVPVIGEQTIIDNKLDRKGHTRAMKDAQRMYNFWTSSAVEQVALQTKSKWFIPVGGTTNLETYYALINQQNYPFIPYNAMDEDGNPLPAPTPIEPPTMAEGFIKGMMVAQNELGMASGQREENFGVQTNAMSGRAINARVDQGDNSTFHYKDGLATAIRQVGNIIIDIAPHIYDTTQLRRIIDPDGTEQLIRIDPNADDAYAEIPGDKPGDEDVRAVFNPKVGRYWVDSDVGPSYATGRQEAWNAFVQITAQNQQLVTQIGDIMFRYADFPGADEIAQRLRKLVPPNVLGEGPDAATQQLMEQNKQLTGLLAEMTETLAKKELELKDKSSRERTEEYRAESDRLKQVGNAIGDLGEDQLRPIIEQTVREMLDDTGKLIDPRATGKAGEPDGDEGGTGGPAGGQTGAEGASPGAGAPPVPGARQAPDGQWYTQGPDGGYMRVEPNG